MNKPWFVRLGDVADFINGCAFKPDDWHTTGLPIIRIQNLTNPNAPFNLTKRLVPSKYHVAAGDLLVSWSATLGVFQWKGPDALVNQHIFKVAADTRKVDLDYLRHALDASIHEMERFTHGSTMKHINRAEFLAHRIPLPPLDEQRRMAAILDKADALRQKRKRAIALLDSLTQSIFLEMFGDPVLNPLGWPLSQLGDLLAGIESGWSPVCLDRRAEPEEWGVLKLSAVTSGIYISQEHKALPLNVDPKPLLEVRPGDVLFTRKNTRDLVAAVALVGKTRAKLMLSDLIFRLIPGPNVLPSFVFGLLSYPTMRKSIQNLVGGAAGSMPNISKEKLRAVTAFVPDLDSQRRFESALRSQLETRQSLVSGAAATGGLFSALQHRAFLGEV